MSTNKKQAYGAFCLVLHSHLPFTRKAGVWPFGEEWLYEGLMETYIPLLEILYDLKKKNISPQFTVSITPVLMEQLADPYLLSRFEQFIDDKIRRAEEDIKRFEQSTNHEFLHLAKFYKTLFSDVKKVYFERYNRDVLSAFRKLQEEGHIEIITCAATHGYLPLFKRDSSIQAQLAAGIEVYKKHMGTAPRGIWLPECAYRPGYYQNVTKNESYYKPGIDEFLVKNGIQYFISDSHAIEGGEAFWGGKRVGLYGEIFSPKIDYQHKVQGTNFKPYLLKSGCTVFGRCKDTGLQVWSGDWGYPADGSYREFHKRESQSGLQYWRITSRQVSLGLKEVYVPANAIPRINENSYHFNHLVEGLLSKYFHEEKTFGMVAAPYDTELFGHWWFEGVAWLKAIAEKMYYNPYVEQMTLGKYLEANPPQQVIELPESSWGEGGKHYVWMNKDTEWMWSYIDEVEIIMENLVEKYPQPNDKQKEVLDQISREVLLLQSSDWPFLITTGQAKEYSSERFLVHYQRFVRLTDYLNKNMCHTPEFEDYFQKVKDIDNLFMDSVDYKMYKRKEPPPLTK